MPKLLIRREENETIYVSNETADYHCKYGKITKEDLAQPDGSTVHSHTGTAFTIITAGFADIWTRHRRIPQSMIAKDIGIIITTCGIGKTSIVAEAGTGNGSLTAQLANICKKVHTYELREKHLENAQKNIEKLGITNVNFNNADVTDSKLKNADALILDVPEPWTSLDAAHRILKIGGWLVTYSPSTTQVHQTRNALSDKWLWDHTIEVIARNWKVAERIVRPDNIAIGHTAFISFIRKLSE